MITYAGWYQSRSVFIRRRAWIIAFTGFLLLGAWAQASP